MMNSVELLREELTILGNPELAQKTNYFFKEPVISYGIRMSIVNSLSLNHFKPLTKKSKVEVFDMCEYLFKSNMLEESIIACHWSYKMKKYYNENDLNLFSEWIDDYIKNWAVCDTFCNHTVGTLIEMFPEGINVLYIWTLSENKWKRRAAAVSLIVPAKKGLFINEILKIAEILLLDPDDMVQKGYGWMLKVASQKHQDIVYDFVIKNKHEMPRTALRYAIEKLPEELRKKAMI